MCPFRPFRRGQVRQLDTVVPVVRVASNASIGKTLCFRVVCLRGLCSVRNPYSVEPFGGILASHLAGRTHNGWQFFALGECGLMRSTTYDNIVCAGLRTGDGILVWSQPFRGLRTRTGTTESRVRTSSSLSVGLPASVCGS